MLSNSTEHVGGDAEGHTVDIISIKELTGL